MKEKTRWMILRFRKQKAAKYVALICLTITVAVMGCAIYLNDYYIADWESIEGFTPVPAVDASQAENGSYVLAPENAKTGFIFYPGGKVAHDAYIPMMKCLASEGVLCVIVEMPYRLAVLDMDAAEGIPEQFPQIETWYIGGHSLGGSMAASYLAENFDEFEGLILLGAYSTADLSETDLSVLSIYGSADLVMNREKYQSNLENLPADFTEIVIDGGCHAYFGMYGAQKGDGTPEITNEEQIRFTAAAILDLINE